MMNKKLFEIPVYSTDKQSYTKMFDENLVKEAYRQQKEPTKDVLKTIREILSYKADWNYNQIIGYITIFITDEDVVFEVYKAIKKVVVFSDKKHWMCNLRPNGLHFRYKDLSNAEIREKINSFLSDIANTFFSKHFLDLEIYNELVSIIDFKKISEETNNG